MGQPPSSREHLRIGFCLSSNGLLAKLEAELSHRLTFLIVESEPEEGLSTRKLLIETAKHNVITAYNGQEGVRTLERFPAVDAIVFDMGVSDVTCEEFAHRIQRDRDKYHLIALCKSDGDEARAKTCADDVITANDPAGLLDMLEEKFGLGEGK